MSRPPLRVMSGSRPVLVTGGAGFLGCNIAHRLAAEGREVRILDSLARPGVEANLAWLKERHKGRIAVLLGGCPRRWPPCGKRRAVSRPCCIWQPRWR